ncbi:hypothetical protein D3C79_791570 [compost metagenome]
MQQVEGAIAQFDVHAQLRVQRHKARHQRHNEALAISHCTGHAQQPFGFTGEIAHRAQGFLAAILQALAVLQKGLPGFAQGHLARTAIEQTGLQAILQSGDLAADMRRGNAQALGRRGELA